MPQPAYPYISIGSKAGASDFLFLERMHLTGMVISRRTEMLTQLKPRKRLSSKRLRGFWLYGVNANLKRSIFAERKCIFSPVSTEVYTRA